MFKTSASAAGLRVETRPATQGPPALWRDARGGGFCWNESLPAPGCPYEEAGPLSLCDGPCRPPHAAFSSCQDRPHVTDASFFHQPEAQLEEFRLDKVKIV